MSHLTKRIEEVIIIMADLKIAVDLLERERDILAEQNVDLRHKLKRLKRTERSGQ